ncbi:Cyclic AMP-responsive element-binding protein 5 [Colletotrichum sojae]|uniref:Cyclic AMP-responsive element-binding protein 5 n=1 Tax=Colletotrichum sojae TaxID=2175907 RepID=A0A8H6INQ1_9PEZI|nr:Cyclic AMP-responsive element-binding protein 5 [Colletotrichum sojae]
MAQMNYAGTAVVAGAPTTLTPFYATTPDQNDMLSPTDEYFGQQWSAWCGNMAEPIYTQGSAAGSMSSLPWGTEGREYQQLDTSNSMAGFTTASWAPQVDGWPPYRQHHLQPPQPAVFNQPASGPTKVCSPSAGFPPWQPARYDEDQNEPRRRTGSGSKKTKNTDGRRRASTTQPPKKVRVGPTAEPSPASSSSYGENTPEVDFNDKGDDSEAPPAPSKQKTYRVKNRAAAKRCREKTKQYEIDLAAREKQVTEERMYLDACVTMLKNEVLTLKSEILQHGDCDCDIIQGYIAKAASGVSAGRT